MLAIDKTTTDFRSAPFADDFLTVKASDDDYAIFEQAASYSYDDYDKSSVKRCFDQIVDAMPSIDQDKYAGKSDKVRPGYERYAVIDTLIETATKSGHFIRIDSASADCVYVYLGSYWHQASLSDLTSLCYAAAIKAGKDKESLTARQKDELVKELFSQLNECQKFATPSNVKTLLNLRNCTVEITRDGIKTKSFDPRDCLTHQLDFDYTPSAVNDDFNAFLRSSIPNQETRISLQQACGYLITRGIKAEKVPMLYGSGSNGKGVLMDVLTAVIGDKNITNNSLESLTKEDSKTLWTLKDAIVNIGSDITVKNISAGNFKVIASGEAIIARMLYKDPFVMRNYAKLLFSINKFDSLNMEQTHGFFRRFLIVPFTQQFTGDAIDAGITDRILKDKSGVLNWLLSGAMDVINSGKIYESDECKNALHETKVDTNSVAQFEQWLLEDDQDDDHGSISFSCSTSGVLTISCNVRNFYATYEFFCKQTGNLRAQVNQHNFSKRMQDLGFRIKKTSSGSVLHKHYQDVAATTQGGDK